MLGMNSNMIIDLTVGATFALSAGVVTFLVTRRDFGPGRAAIAATTAGVAVGLSWFMILYLAVAAFIVAIATYVFLRRGFRLSTAKVVVAAIFAFSTIALLSEMAFRLKPA
jgi:hypothetical protein